MDAHAPALYDKRTILAVRALTTGTANEGQQKLALDWIINQAALTYDMSYRPVSQGGELATAFAEGRRFVGNQIIKMLRSETLEAQEKFEQQAPVKRRGRKPEAHDENQ